MFEVKNLGYKVGKKVILKNISTSFNAGKLHMIIGPNGAGKSTLLKTLSGSILPSSGELMFFEKKISDYSSKDLSRIRAVLSQQHEPAFPIACYDLVMMGRYPYFETSPGAKDHEICRHCLSLFGAEEFSNRMYHELSGGEAQRIHFARVMAQAWNENPDQPKFLLLDEPLTFLDIYFQFEFLEQLKKIIKTQHTGIIAVVHDLNIAARFGDHIYMMHQGELVDQGCPTELFTPEKIKSVFGIQPEISIRNQVLHLSF